MSLTSYDEALEFLFSRLPMYQRQGGAAMRPGLGNITRLLEGLGNPHHRFKSIHIAGTNGKGSTAHYIASILQAHGLKVGLYTSPHFCDFRERIRINGKLVPKKWVVDFVNRCNQTSDDLKPSFFEYSTAMAFAFFAEQTVDVAVVETGLGGRLDSTNVLRSDLSVITSIGLDHQQFLGDTLGQIAGEKAGIIKAGRPVVLGHVPPEARTVIENKARENGSPLLLAFPDGVQEKATGQQLSMDMAKTAAGVFLTQHGERLKPDRLKAGLELVRPYTGLLGRFQLEKVAGKQLLLDVGHNEEAVSMLVRRINTELQFDRLWIVWGMSADKSVDAVLRCLPETAIFTWVSAQVPRAMDSHVLQQKGADAGLVGDVADSVEKALANALQNAGSNDLIWVGGSFFVVAEIIGSKFFPKNESDILEE